MGKWVRLGGRELFGKKRGKEERRITSGGRADMGRNQYGIHVPREKKYGTPRELGFKSNETYDVIRDPAGLVE